MKYLSCISSFLAGQRLLLLLCLTSLFALEGWGTTTTGTINFGSTSGYTNINATSVSGSDSQSNTWTVTTSGTTSFTSNASYAQVGSSSNPASTITFTMTLASSQTINEMSAKFGGFSGTSGKVTLKVGSDTIGTGSLNNTEDIIVTSNKEASGTVLKVIVNSIAKGVKCYYISYTYGATKYTVTWKNNGETYATTSVIDGKKPVFPSNPSSCDLTSDLFYGWTQTTWDGTIDDISGKTTDETKIYTTASAMPNVDGAVTYYAVFAKGVYDEEETPVLRQTLTYDSWTYSGTTDDKNKYRLFGNDSYVQSESFDLSGLTKVTVYGGTFGGEAYNGISIKDADGNTWKTGTVSGASETGTNDFTDGASLTGKKALRVYSTSGNGSGTGVRISKIQIYTYPYIYSKYLTSCIACATNVTLDGGSPSNGTVTFANTTLPTCDEDKTVTMTINPADGYQLHTFSVATGDGKVATKSMSASPELDNNSSAPQEITLTFAKDADGAYDVTATFTEMVVTNWSWTNHDDGAALTTDPIEIYVDQQARVDVTYTPAKADLLSSHTAASYYNHDATGSAYVRNPNKASEYFTFYGKASTGEETTTITLTHSDDTSNPKSFPQLIYVKVLPLPRVHFEDLIHNESFADVVATISDNALAPTKTTPTHDDLDTPGSGNACELVHLHLMGWIRSDYSEVEDYLAGERDALSISEITSAGTGYWFTPNADINVLTYNGKTFYAVWAKIE